MTGVLWFWIDNNQKDNSDNGHYNDIRESNGILFHFTKLVEYNNYNITTTTTITVYYHLVFDDDLSEVSSRNLRTTVCLGPLWSILVWRRRPHFIAETQYKSNRQITGIIKERDLDTSGEKGVDDSSALTGLHVEDSEADIPKPSKAKPLKRWFPPFLLK